MNTTVSGLHSILRNKNLLSDKDVKGKSITLRIVLIEPPIVRILQHVAFINLTERRPRMKMKTPLWRSFQCDVPTTANQPPVCTTLLHLI